MQTDNFFKAYRKITQTAAEALPSLFSAYAQHLGVQFVGELKTRTPVDYGNLRNAWALLPLQKSGNKYVIKAANPMEYGAFIEFGYTQRPGMILKMQDARGKLRFLAFLGYSPNYGIGASNRKKEPNEDGEVVICTRKRMIPGRFMARESLLEMKKRIPEYNRRLMAKLWQFMRVEK